MSRDDSESWSVALDADTTAPRAARRALVEWFPDLPVQARENALVAVTELVTNAVRFGEPPIHVRRPRRRIPAEDGGVGLNLVYLLADRVEIERDRSCVRCEFATTADRVVPSAGELSEAELVWEGPAVRIVLRGEIDLAAAPELERLFTELERSRPDRVVVDLREVTFFDTTGLRLAHRLDRWGRDHSVPVVFTRGIPGVMLALRSAGLALRLRFTDD